jgi:hypothetical protein
MFKVLFYITFKPFIKTPMAGAQTSIYLAVDPDVANITGKYFRYIKCLEGADTECKTVT